MSNRQLLPKPLQESSKSPERCWSPSLPLISEAENDYNLDDDDDSENDSNFLRDENVSLGRSASTYESNTNPKPLTAENEICLLNHCRHSSKIERFSTKTDFADDEGEEENEDPFDFGAFFSSKLTLSTTSSLEIESQPSLFFDLARSTSRRLSLPLISNGLDMNKHSRTNSQNNSKPNISLNSIPSHCQKSSKPRKPSMLRICSNPVSLSVSRAESIEECGPSSPSSPILAPRNVTTHDDSQRPPFMLKSYTIGAPSSRGREKIPHL